MWSVGRIFGRFFQLVITRRVRPPIIFPPRGVPKNGQRFANNFLAKKFLKQRILFVKKEFMILKLVGFNWRIQIYNEFYDSSFFSAFLCPRKKCQTGGRGREEGKKKNKRRKWDGAEYFNLHTTPERRLEWPKRQKIKSLSSLLCQCPWPSNRGGGRGGDELSLFLPPTLRELFSIKMSDLLQEGFSPSGTARGAIETGMRGRRREEKKGEDSVPRGRKN